MFNRFCKAKAGRGGLIQCVDCSTLRDFITTLSSRSLCGAAWISVWTLGTVALYVCVSGLSSTSSPSRRRVNEFEGVSAERFRLKRGKETFLESSFDFEPELPKRDAIRERRDERYFEFAR